MRSAAAIALAVAWLGCTANAHPAGVRLVVDGPEQVLSDQDSAGCDAADLPDAPARAFRNQQGQMVLFAPNYINRAFVGADLDHLARDCAIRFKAGGSAEPNLLDDRTWLDAFHTADGKNVFAFASASFIPYRHGAVCAAGNAHTDCWLNGIAALASTDGGQTFRYLGDPPGHLPFPPPAAYRPDVADPPGYMMATNFVTRQGALYSILWRRGERPGDPPANCLVRAAVDDLHHWEAWSRDGFRPIADFVDGRWQARATTCAAIGFQSLTPIRGIVFDPSSQTFIAVFQYRDTRRNEQGFYTATSSDLVAWSKPEKLLAIALSANDEPAGSWAGYPSIIDDSSNDPDFGTISEISSLLFVRFVPFGKSSVARQLIRIPLRVEPDG